MVDNMETNNQIGQLKKDITHIKKELKNIKKRMFEHLKQSNPKKYAEFLKREVDKNNLKNH